MGLGPWNGFSATGPDDIGEDGGALARAMASGPSRSQEVAPVMYSYLEPFEAGGILFDAIQTDRVMQRLHKMVNVSCSADLPPYLFELLVDLASNILVDEEGGCLLQGAVTTVADRGDICFQFLCKGDVPGS